MRLVNDSVWKRANWRLKAIGHRAPLVIMAAALLLAAGCGDLDVELPDEDKDNLAAFVDDPTPAEDVVQPPSGELPEVDVTGIDRLDHLAWDAILATHVENGLVDYQAIADSIEATELLERYVGLLAVMPPEQLNSPDERLAFWLNAYNALVVRQAIAELAANPSFSPQDNNFAFFKAQVHTVGGELYSLDQIEHGVIRGDRTHDSVSQVDDAAWAVYLERHAGISGTNGVDPRIHVGLNCGAVSCPLLPDFAFTGPQVDAQLTQRAELFVQDTARGAGPAGISSLFNWFAVDFNQPPYNSAQGFIQAFRPEADDVNFGTFLNYDWTLNSL